MADFDLDLNDFIAPLVRINTPDGALEIRCDMTHVVGWRVVRWMDSYRPFMGGNGDGEPPSIEEMFEMAAEVTGKPVETMHAWGSVACIRLLDFLAARFFAFLVERGKANQTNGEPPSNPPSDSVSKPEALSV